MSEKATIPEEIADRVRSAMESITGDLPPTAVFSVPVEAGGRTIITAASFERAGGFGFGGGGGSAGGGGGGGGGQSAGRPVAVIVISADGVTVEPVIDVTRLSVTVAIGVLAAWKAWRR